MRDGQGVLSDSLEKLEKDSSQIITSGGAMLKELSQKTSLFSVLHRIDLDLANQCRQKGCPHCGGPLHQANYERKPRGGPDNLPQEYMIRQSLCCGRKNCRKRTLPPSCLFMDRRVYWTCIILLVMALRQNRPQGASAIEIMKIFGICRRTLFRWIAYFREEFAQSEKWQRLRGRVTSLVEDCRLPASLLEHFLQHNNNQQEGLVACIHFLATG